MAFGLNCLGGEGEEKEEEEDLLSFHSIVTFFSCLEVSLWFLIFFFLLSWVLVAARGSLVGACGI